MSTSKVIKDTLEGFQRWQLPEVEGSHVVEKMGADKQRANMVTAEDLERIQEEAYKEAYDAGREQGYKDGLRAAEKDIARRGQELADKTALFNALLAKLDKPMENLDQQVEKELVHLAVAIARQIIRREIKTDPGQIMAAVREAVAVLPSAARNVRLHLHPEDLTLVREVMMANSDAAQWTLVEDPTLSRGGCRVSTDTSQVDATVENRIGAIASQLLGGEREYDQPEPQTESESRGQSEPSAGPLSDPNAES